ncbi:hypothetical protein HaLaN_04712 [Haematococcus lacustris]|uniref:Uncharacterized protein n=1 Tax=Haematococcus lacustris TaxID=44745 RepID=A0A699YJW2_HAELA|nr:hypothetical protein HaLaN_04712 [Haematococcus lacustris]
MRVAPGGPASEAHELYVRVRLRAARAYCMVLCKMVQQYPSTAWLPSLTFAMLTIAGILSATYAHKQTITHHREQAMGTLINVGFQVKFVLRAMMAPTISMGAYM